MPIIVPHRYQITFDEELEVATTIDLGPAIHKKRTVNVVAQSVADAHRKAKIIVGGESQ